MAEGRENIGPMLPGKEGDRQHWVEERKGEVQTKQVGVFRTWPLPAGTHHLQSWETQGCSPLEEGEMLQTHAHGAEVT